MAKKRRDRINTGQGGATRQMYGISGVQRYGGVSRVYDEFLRELQGPQGMKNYREMADNDPIIGSMLFAAQHLCRKVSYKFKPANNSLEARKIANFMGGAVFDDLDMTWQDVVSEILSMLPYGWAFMEFNFKRRLGPANDSYRIPSNQSVMQTGPQGIGSPVPKFSPSRFNDGLIGFESWSLRSQETLFMWEWDEQSHATVMQQMAAPDYRIRRIPMNKGLLFRTQVARNNPEGRSILRNCWTSYYLKKNLQIFEGIGIERDLAGYPLIQIKEPDMAKGLIPPDIWNEKDPKAMALLLKLQQIVKSIRQDEQAGLVMPWWAQFSLISGSSRRRVDTNNVIQRYDQRMAQAMMADFIMLGHEAVGSKALAATKISLFTAALSSFLDLAGAVIDREATPLLMRFNGFPTELTPTFTHGDVESMNVEELGRFIQAIAGTGFNPLAGFDAQKAIMDAAKLPFSDPQELGPIPLKGQQGNGNGNGNGSRQVPRNSQGALGNSQIGGIEDGSSPVGPVAAEEANTQGPDLLTSL
jgi:hypothetical protein